MVFPFAAAFFIFCLNAGAFIYDQVMLTIPAIMSKSDLRLKLEKKFMII